jgi:Fe2+ transport system protein FeoA
VVGFQPGVNPDQQARLFAYGVAPAVMIKVTQHRPVTIIQVEHLDLALQAGIAEAILVERII